MATTLRILKLVFNFCLHSMPTDALNGLQEVKVGIVNVPVNLYWAMRVVVQSAVFLYRTLQIKKVSKKGFRGFSVCEGFTAVQKTLTHYL